MLLCPEMPGPLNGDGRIHEYPVEVEEHCSRQKLFHAWLLRSALKRSVRRDGQSFLRADGLKMTGDEMNTCSWHPAEDIVGTCQVEQCQFGKKHHSHRQRRLCVLSHGWLPFWFERPMSC